MIRTNTDEPINKAVRPDRRLVEQTGAIHGREGRNGGAQGTGMSIKYVRRVSRTPGSLIQRLFQQRQGPLACYTLTAMDDDDAEHGVWGTDASPDKIALTHGKLGYGSCSLNACPIAIL